MLASSGCYNKIPQARQLKNLLTWPGTENLRLPAAFCILAVHLPRLTLLSRRKGPDHTEQRKDRLFFLFLFSFSLLEANLNHIFIYLCVRSCMCCRGQLTGISCHLPYVGRKNRTQAFELGDFYPQHCFAGPIFLFACLFPF